jgi:hypothetical protein
MADQALVSARIPVATAFGDSSPQSCPQILWIERPELQLIIRFDVSEGNYSVFVSERLLPKTPAESPVPNAALRYLRCRGPNSHHTHAQQNSRSDSRSVL